LLETEAQRNWEYEKKTIQSYLVLLNQKKRDLWNETTELRKKMKSVDSRADQTELDGRIAILSGEIGELENTIKEILFDQGTHNATPPLTPELFAFMVDRGINTVVDATFINTIGTEFDLLENTARGHCGYLALRDMFLEMDYPNIHKKTAVNHLRKMVWELFMDNPQETHNTIFRMMGEGAMDYTVDFFNEIKDNIWNEETNWKQAVESQYHMDFQFDIPVICWKLDLNIMVYDLNRNQTFFYSPTESKHIAGLQRNFILGEVESVYCMVRYNEHYRYIRTLNNAR
jgi:hypothetical protein